MKRRAFLSLAGAAPLALVRPVASSGTSQLAREPDIVVIGGDPAAFSAVYRLAQDPARRVVFLQDAPPRQGGARAPVTEALAEVPPFARGHRLCFDGWRTRGNPGWGYDDVLAFFKRIETYEAGASAVRGGDGPLSVAHCWDPHAAHRGFLMACAMSGFQQDSRHDFNGPRTQGIAGYYQKAIRDDRPHTPAGAFLTPLVGSPSRRPAARGWSWRAH
jgi:choline dehydrogenase-like flavoprotein